VAKLFAHLVNWRTMLEAQAMAVALAVYVTDENLAGTVARQYGFLTSQQGVGAAMFDVDEALWDGSAQILFGCESASVLSVMTILDQVDARSGRGVIFGGSDGRLQFGELLLRWMSTELFTAINEAGSIV
jgi:hypothetical protein